ncbi:trypsin-like serine peptidase [Streptacidiphilus fuscans]|uniref:Serine protease n=1 Tax=Streptacidiphilus fuscans TaxID=2789292 RepID=A0A931FDG9_9ACTN|nr:hypothetical protein [Streptacidiphilus fuscans]MBF9070697.1 hypothetical protein [Streptacidiphilus fuscans]
MGHRYRAGAGALVGSGLLLAGVTLSFTSAQEGTASAAGTQMVPVANTTSLTTSPSSKAGAKTKPSPRTAAKAAPTHTPTPTPAPTVTAVPTADVPETASGQSQVLSASQQSAKVGAIFSSSSITPGNHHCTASVVDSPSGDVIVTAAHCLSAGNGGGAVFVPDYRDGGAPDGAWPITQVVESSGWTGDGDQDDDVAFAVVASQNGRSLESVVGGGYTLSTESTTNATVQLSGYPSATDEPITCTGSASAFSGTQLTVYCTAFTGGTSGSAWLAGYDPATDSGSIIGVIGGYEQGGDTADTSYSIVFTPATQSLYDEVASS